jgi:hypothetical protein
VLGHDGDNDGWIFGTLALVDCGGIGRNQHVELAKSVGDGSAVEKSDKFSCIKIDLVDVADVTVRWALVMIRLWAACLNTSVSRTTGTAPECDNVGQYLAGPDRRELSMSPPIRRAALSGNAFISALTIPNGRGLRGGSNQRAPRKTGVLPLANHTEPMSGFPTPAALRAAPSVSGRHPKTFTKRDERHCSKSHVSGLDIG